MELIKDIVRITTPLLISNDIHFSKKIKCNSYIFTQEELLRTVIINIITNAIEVPRKNSTKKITLNVFESKIKKCLVIEISDNGIGINKKLRKQIFIPGFSTKSGKNRGFGLFHCIKLLKENLNGSLNYKTSCCGTTFTIELKEHIIFT